MTTDGAAAVEAFLAALPPDQQAALRALRATIARFLPDHVECMSYAMPGFRQPGVKGRMIAGYAAFRRHLGLYSHSGTIIPTLDCRPFKTSKSGILFTPATPLPDTLVETILRARQAEIATALRP
ncbi:iron chaperone [Tabrizicola sp. M-4]|uniref:iron chaperone n=1 Tax=Tabrizicola sp. M-4 TaxID=3055847 RepID=UPI003DAA05A0